VLCRKQKTACSLRHTPFDQKSGLVAAAVISAAISPTGALGLRLGLINGQIATVQVRAVEGVDGFLSLVRRAHGDETEAAGPASLAIRHEIGLKDGAVGREGVLQRVFGGFEGKIPNE